MPGSRLLQRQLKSVGLNQNEIPKNLMEWDLFLAKIVKAYNEADQDRYLLERSLELSSKEMEDRWSKLQESEARKNAIILSSIDSIISVDREGKIVEFNPAAEKTFGYTRKDIINKNISNLIHPFRPGYTVEHIFKNFLETGQSDEFNNRKECLGIKSNGEQFSMELVFIPIKLDKDLHFSMYIRDLTEQKESELTIIEQQLKIVSVERMASIGMMAAGIAHEINNPLAIIMATTTFIKKLIKKDKLTTEKLIESVESIEGTIARLSKIVKGLKNVSRDSQDFQKIQVPVQDIFDDIFGLCSERFKNTGVDLQFIISDQNKDMLLNCDRVQFSQVLINLLTNAFDAIETLKEKWVKIEVMSEKEFDVIKISDCGPGISDSSLSKIFTPFFTSKEIGKGTGLGLPISKAIIERHEGTIEVDSNCPNTCFVIKLPK